VHTSGSSNTTRSIWEKETQAAAGRRKEKDEGIKERGTRLTPEGGEKRKRSLARKKWATLGGRRKGKDEERKMG
jgi:hypothetical protein